MTGVKRLYLRSGRSSSVATIDASGTLRTFTPDGSLAFGWDRDTPGFFWSTGQGGYGIETSVGLSRCAASLVTGKGLPDDVKARYDVSSVKRMIANAAPWSFALKQMYLAYFPGDSLFEVYGSTELGVNCVLRPEDQLRKPGSCGKPSPMVEIKLFDDDGNEVTGTGPEHTGELFVKSPSVFADYYKQHDKFMADNKHGYQTVGDIAYRDDEGYIYICDRKKDMIISGGMNIYPAEIEAARELGVRFHPTRGSMSLSEKDGGLPPDDVVADDDAATQVLQEFDERVGLFHRADGFVAGDAVDGDRGTVVVEFEHDLEGIVEMDFVVLHGDGADGDDAIAARVEAGGFAVEHDEAGVIDFVHTLPTNVAVVSSSSFKIDWNAVLKRR